MQYPVHLGRVVRREVQHCRWGRLCGSLGRGRDQDVVSEAAFERAGRLKGEVVHCVAWQVPFLVRIVVDGLGSAEWRAYSKPSQGRTFVDVAQRSSIKTLPWVSESRFSHRSMHCSIGRFRAHLCGLVTAHCSLTDRRHWSRAAIPADIGSRAPLPLTWGLPVAAFHASTCDPYKYFQPAIIIMNINLCGESAPIVRAYSRRLGGSHLLL